MTYKGSDKLILGIVLAVITFWLFAQTTLNVAPAMRDDLRISDSANNIAVSRSRRAPRKTSFLTTRR